MNDADTSRESGNKLTQDHSSPWRKIPGAVVDLEQNRIDHYGSFLREQKLLQQGKAVVDVSWRSVFTIEGADRLRWLHSLSSQKLDQVKTGDSYEALFLDPSGHIRFAIGCVDDSVRTWVFVDTSSKDELFAWLQSMKFLFDVRLVDCAQRFCVVGAFGKKELGAYHSKGHPVVWQDPWGRVAEGGHQYSQTASHPGEQWTWHEHVVERQQINPVIHSVQSSQLHAAGYLAWQALRMAAWRPCAGVDVDHKGLPHEFDWLRSAVHLKKGCYCGQETVAKIHNLGHPPRRFVLLHLESPDSGLPQAGEEVLYGEKRVGSTVCSGMHYEYGPLALALVKRTLPEEAHVQVRCGETSLEATQEIIVPSDAGGAVEIPRRAFYRPEREA